MSERLSILLPKWLKDQAQAKARRDASEISRITRRLIWAWLNGQIDPYNLPDPPDQPSR